MRIMIFCLGLVSGPLSARFLAVASQLFKVPGVPFPLSPSHPGLWQVDEAAGTVMVAAQAHSDIFIDPGDGFANGSSGGDAGISLNAESMLNAATLLGVPPDGDFQFSARVTVGFASTFDAGVLLLWLDERRWAKLCFEFSPPRRVRRRERLRRAGPVGLAPGLAHRPGLRVPCLA
jgi:Protein of unknown function (DUF1349)